MAIDPPMYSLPKADLSVILLAALAWLHEHDTGSHAELMDENIDRDALAAALDRVEATP